MSPLYRHFFILLMIAADWAAPGQPVPAAVSTWQNGFNVMPRSADDFGSDSFKQSMRNMRALGINAVAFVLPYYQSNIYSTDVGPGWNTPSDATLAEAIDYAHSVGLSVALKVHVDPYDGNWRAMINPGDRAGWFNNYGNVLMRVAQIAQAHHAEMIVVGTEFVSMAADNMNSTNTQNWHDLIGRVRGVYQGALTYSANSSSNNPADTFSDEKAYIAFWSSLDYAGISAYYSNPASDNSVATLMAQWDYLNNNDIAAFSRTVGKPILITEVGYRSITGAHQEPWNWWRGGAYDETEQANAYQALMQYWNDYGYIVGTYWWNWSTDPNAGGAGDTTYVPQHKQAEQVIKNWMTGSQPPQSPPSGGGAPPSFTLSASANPAQVAVGGQTTVTASVIAGGTFSNGIIDIEIYDQNHAKVFQKFYPDQNMAAGETRTFSIGWTPAQAGIYTVKVGAFSMNWGNAYAWNDNAASINAGSAVAPPPPSGSQSTEIWWPTDGASVSGLQTFKMMVQNIPTAQYQSWWQVDGGSQNAMQDSAQDYPHKEALVDLSGWRWKGTGPYMVTFVSKDGSGAIISQKSVNISVF